MRIVIQWLFLFCCALPLWAQSWDTLRGLKTGDRVRVTDSAGQAHTGTLSRVSGDSITLQTSAGETAMERSRVKRVELRSSSRRVRNLLIGVGIGVAVGVTVDQSLGTYFRNESGESGGARALTYVAPIAVFGGIGAALPAYRTIYKVR